MVIKSQSASARRAFLKGSAAATVAAVLPAACVPNTAFDDPTTSGELTPDSSGNLTLALADYPALEDVGGFVNLNVSTLTQQNGGCDSGNAPIIVIRAGTDSVVAHLNRCTHQGARVQVNGDQLRCPCHGTLFNLETGAYISGQGNGPLRTFQTEFLSGSGTILISGLA